MQTNKRGERYGGLPVQAPPPHLERNWRTDILKMRIVVHTQQLLQHFRVGAAPRAPYVQPPSATYAPDSHIAVAAADSQLIDLPSMLDQDETMGDPAPSGPLAQGDEVAASAAKTPDAENRGAPPRLQTRLARR